jgi:hypothetical protein
MHGVEIYSAEPSSAKLDVPKSKSRWSDISRSSDNLSEMVIAEPDD